KLLTAAQPPALRWCVAVEEDRAGGEQPFRLRPGPDLGERRDEAVDPLAGGFVRNASLHSRAADGCDFNRPGGRKPCHPDDADGDPPRPARAATWLRRRR